jgi:3-phosphoshikimate 1-carboxyvinyltransferase
MKPVATSSKKPMPKPLTARRSEGLSGRLKVPGDKSISHRALILGALATGRTQIVGLLEADDIMATAGALTALGVEISQQGQNCEVKGLGVGGLRQPAAALDFGNSGTGARLMMGVVAGHDMVAEFTGDESLCRRPMGRVLTPLIEMGLEVEGEGTTLPLTLHGSQDLIPIRYELPVPSAQVKSSVLLAGLHAPGRTSVIEPVVTRDHTERMLRYFGGEIQVEDRNDGSRVITVTGDAELTGTSVNVPSDPSSAAFPIAAAIIAPNSELFIQGLLMNPTRAGFVETVQEMGGDIEILDLYEASGEKIANLKVKSSALSGITVPAERAPSMIDEYPILAVLAACAEGETRMCGLAELKVKESNRLQATADGLVACGIEARIEGDDLIVTGMGPGNVPGGAEIATYMDHRIAMAFLILGLASREPVTIDDGTMIATSFPGFVAMMQDAGADIA